MQLKNGSLLQRIYKNSILQFAGALHETTDALEIIVTPETLTHRHSYFRFSINRNVSFM